LAAEGGYNRGKGGPFALGADQKADASWDHEPHVPRGLEAVGQASLDPR
jgi:hypothetical protein